MSLNNLITETLLLSKQSSNEERVCDIKNIKKEMKKETKPNVIAFFEWYVTTLENWNNKK